MKSAIIYYPGFLSRVGGAFFHARNVETELRTLGWDVTVITLDSLPLWCRYAPHLLQIAGNAVYMPFGFLFKSNLIKFLFRRLFDRKADLRIFEDAYVAWNSEIPTITMLHAVWSDNLQAFSVETDRLEKFKACEAEKINGLHHPVVTVSYPYRKYIADEHFAERLSKKIDVVELGRDQSEFQDVQSDNRDRKSIVYSGVLEARKNLFFLFDVFKALREIDPEFKLTIIGDGPDRHRLMEASRIHKLSVKFLGKLSYEGVAAELQRHAIYLHTSVKESFSYSLLEAKLAGLKTCAYAKLQVPEEFIDRPIEEFSVDAWCAGLLSLDFDTDDSFDGSRYTAERMTVNTLKLLDLN